tara:strand:+ start:541 stop:702 length:162 start_codon:yes stop_codon:yes gene_type:complete
MVAGRKDFLLLLLLNSQMHVNERVAMAMIRNVTTDVSPRKTLLGLNRLAVGKY